MKMKGADRQLLCQCLKGHRRFLFQQATGPGNFVHLLLLRIASIRLAALTGTKAIGDSRLNTGVKAHILPQRSPRTAGRAATDTGGQYGKDKLTIGSHITIAHRLPAAIVGISNYRFHNGLLL